MHRHTGGFIFTQQFADFLRDKHHAEEAHHAGEVLSLEYVCCAEGEKAGMSWWKLTWISLLSAPAESHFKIGETCVFIHRQSRRGLRDRLLHYAAGQVIVRK